MPLPRAEREIERLTECWPAEPENFELAAFAVTFRSERPELSAPALDRIGRLVDAALVRRERSAARKLRARTAMLRSRRFAPLAAAAALVLAFGTWRHFRPAAPAADDGAPLPGVPIIHSQSVPSAGSPSAPAASKPVVN